MNTENEAYKTHIFKKAINKYLDKILPYREQDALNSLLHQIDDIVWKIATMIYVESGYKVDFALIRDIANSRIELLKENIANQKAEESKLKAELEAKGYEKINQRDNKDSEEKKKEYFLKTFGNADTYKLFVKLREILVTKLEVKPELVCLDSHIVDDLGADDLDIAEIIMELEEKFNIQIENKSSGYFRSINLSFDCSLTPISGSVRNLLNYIAQQISSVEKV